jgi:hypothetical protein
MKKKCLKKDAVCDSKKMAYYTIPNGTRERYLGKDLPEIIQVTKKTSVFPGLEEQLSTADTIFEYAIRSRPGRITRHNIALGRIFDGRGEHAGSRRDFLRIGSLVHPVTYVEKDPDEQTPRVRVVGTRLGRLLRVADAKLRTYLVGDLRVTPVAYDSVMGSYIGIVRAEGPIHEVSGEHHFVPHEFVRESILRLTDQRLTDARAVLTCYPEYDLRATPEENKKRISRIEPQP